MAKKRKRGGVSKLPVRRPRTRRVGEDRKLSEIIKEMALRLLKDPDATPSAGAAEAALLLASAAWNSASGDPNFPNQHREALKKVDWGRAVPWAELCSTDAERLIAGLVEYKQAHYPKDRRRIVAVGTSPEGSLRSPGASSSTPIARNLVARMKRQCRGKIVDLKSVFAGRAIAEELQKTVVSEERLREHHPAHAAYIYAQNQVSVMSEQLTALDEMDPFTDIVSKAQDLYMPGGPPMSPLTSSYFTSWAFFDACVEPSHETIGTTILEVGAAFGIHAELLRIMRLMQESRMGLYMHEGGEGSTVVLRELVTDVVCRAIVPSGYRGKKGELWYVRVFPPPLPGGSEHVVFTTPYILLKPGPNHWDAYFRRTLPDAPKQARLDAYERHMKYGVTRTYWNEFVFEAYVNHRTEAIYLAGLPDVPESRPHSEVNSRRMWR